MINKVFTKKKIVEAEQIVAQGEMTDKEIKCHYMQNDVIKIEEVTYEEKFDD